MNEERISLLSQVAVWYYEDRLDQAEIAHRIHRSRSMVSRMLKEVRDLGLIDIRVKYPLRRNSRLEHALVKRFGMRGAWVINTSSAWNYEMKLRVLGRVGAACLLQHVTDGVRIGVAWSRTLSSVVTALDSHPLQKTSVVQISGSVVGKRPEFDGPELVRALAEKLNGEYRFFPAPLVVRDSALRERLIGETTIAETLRLAASCDVALVGVGNICSAKSSIRMSNLIDEWAYQELLGKGVVGDVLARQFDARGTMLDAGFNQRVVGLEPEKLKAIPTVIGVSTGRDKVRSILGAIRGGWIDVLISDAATVGAVLELDQVLGAA